MYIRKNYSLTPIFIMLSLIGCASKGGMAERFIKSSADATYIIENAQRILIVSDGCVSTGDYIYYDYSYAAQKKLSQMAKIYLENKGYDVSIVEKKSICASQQVLNEWPVRYGDKVNGPIVQGYPPFEAMNSTEDETRINKEIDETLNTTAQVTKIVLEKYEIEESKYSNASLETDGPAMVRPVEPKIPVGLHVNAGINSLQGVADAELVVFIMSNGRDVSFGKTFSQQMLTGMITGILSGGLVVASGEASFEKVYVTLFDNKTDKLIWTNFFFTKLKNYADYLKYYGQAFPEYTFHTLSAKKVSINATDGISQKEARALLADKTVFVRKNNASQVFRAYFKYTGQIRSDGFDDVRLDGFWKIGVDGKLCIEFRQEHCGSLMMLENGQYQFGSKDEDVNYIIEKIEEGNPYYM